MSPPQQSFPPSALQHHLPKKLNTSHCPLKQLTQFECVINEREDEPVVCFPVVRIFKA